MGRANVEVVWATSWNQNYILGNTFLLEVILLWPKGKLWKKTCYTLQQFVWITFSIHLKQQIPELSEVAGVDQQALGNLAISKNIFNSLTTLQQFCVYTKGTFSQLSSLGPTVAFFTLWLPHLRPQKIQSIYTHCAFTD